MVEMGCKIGAVCNAISDCRPMDAMEAVGAHIVCPSRLVVTPDSAGEHCSPLRPLLLVVP